MRGRGDVLRALADGHDPRGRLWFLGARDLSALKTLAHVERCCGGYARETCHAAQRDIRLLSKHLCRPFAALHIVQGTDFPIHSHPPVGLRRIGRMFPYGGHGLRRQARYLADRPVGQVRMRRDDPLGGGTAVCLRQGQAMRDVLLYGAQEYVRLAAVEEYDVDCLTALQRRGDQAVHAVDDTHGALVH